MMKLISFEGVRQAMMKLIIDESEGVV